MRALLLLPLLLLPACKEEAPRAPAGDPRAAEARAAAEAALAPRLAGGALRGVQAFGQAQGGAFAVCGRLDPGPAEPLRPWVALVAFERNAPAVQWLVLAGAPADTARAFAEMTDRCFEGGGTARGAPRPPATLPPPTEPPRAEPPRAAAPEAPPAAAAPAPAGRTVTTSERTPVNLRARPGGGGEVLRTVPRATRLEVFAEAPGGWLQVGQGGTPWGWVHLSVLSLY
ncbi:SH3 domain-containing protein [Roseococcus sp. DSY-14]|uniref:SH3 domain-containing protein n=1 Tax=Roseococcus sp. DSY-14 TaxID=3369650 RepID=UPI00387B22AE